VKPLPTYALPLSLAIALGGAAASMVGLLDRHLYALERASLAAQATGQDIVTLCIVVPLLIAASLGAAKGSMRARLALGGLLAYFVYTYFQYTALTVYNSLFLLYVLVYSGALILLIVLIGSIELVSLSNYVPVMPFRRALGIFLTVAGVALGLLWLSMIVPPLIAGARPVILEDQVSQSLVVQSMDLGLLIPAAVIGGVSLLRNRPVGYLLAALVLTKIVTLGTAIIAMMIVMTARGVPVSEAQAILFTTVDGLGIYFAVRFFLAIHPQGTGE
jgi:hypothetical protein